MSVRVAIIGCGVLGAKIAGCCFVKNFFCKIYEYY